MVTIDCVADLHGHYPKLEGGDLLIVAGDLTARDTESEYNKYLDWIKTYADKYSKIITIAGNHDNFLVDNDYFLQSLWGNNWDYLRDSGTEFEGLKVWGSPWTPLFEGINPRCAAFTGVEDDLADKFEAIPHDVDILITHGPCKNILDETVHGKHVGVCIYMHGLNIVVGQNCMYSGIFMRLMGRWSFFQA